MSQDNSITLQWFGRAIKKVRWKIKEKDDNKNGR